MVSDWIEFLQESSINWNLQNKWFGSLKFNEKCFAQINPILKFKGPVDKFFIFKKCLFKMSFGIQDKPVSQ